MSALDERQAYEAMRFFVAAYWERAGCKDDDIAQLLRWAGWENGQPSNPAMWTDWLEAVHEATNRTVDDARLQWDG